MGGFGIAFWRERLKGLETPLEIEFVKTWRLPLTSLIVQVKGITWFNMHVMIDWFKVEVKELSNQILIKPPGGTGTWVEAWKVHVVFLALTTWDEEDTRKEIVDDDKNVILGWKVPIFIS